MVGILVAVAMLALIVGVRLETVAGAMVLALLALVATRRLTTQEPHPDDRHDH